jgi:hypothetical protein
MKTFSVSSLWLSAWLLFLNPIPQSYGQSNTYSVNIVGYVNIFFLPGDTLFGNPLENAPNQLTNLFPSAPNGATVSIWNSGSQQFSPASTYHLGSGWDVNYQIPVGAGALLHTATLFTNTFVGNVLTGPGPEEINPPTPPALGAGIISVVQFVSGERPDVS